MSINQEELGHSGQGWEVSWYGVEITGRKREKDEKSESQEIAKVPMCGTRADANALLSWGMIFLGEVWGNVWGVGGKGPG